MVFVGQEFLQIHVDLKLWLNYYWLIENHFKFATESKV